MLMNPYIAVALVWAHFVGDFIFQNDKMAINKSTNSYWLAWHVLVYSTCFWPFILFLGFWNTLWFVLINYCAHFMTDYVTSRVTSKLYKAGRRHAFFTVIGLDQALHMTVLFLSYSAVRSW